MRRRAVSLVELLTVVGIIIVLILILIPVINIVRKHAHKSKCINNLRQIGIAMQMYRSDYKDAFPDKLRMLLPYSKTTAVFSCPSESVREESLLSQVEGLPTNYVTILRDLSDASNNTNLNLPGVQAAKILMALDTNYGFAVCILHGRRISNNEPMLGTHEGLMLRLQIDASVKPVHVYYVWSRSGGTIPGWFVFSNVRPCPENVARLAPLMLNCPPDDG